MNYTLREYQEEDVQFGLARKGGIINANPPGLGKTLETLDTLNRLPEGTTLVISPKMATGVWEYEANKWLGWKCLRITGEYKKEERQKIREEYDRGNTRLLIINVAMLEEIQAWRSIWDYVVIDEVHLLGLLNPTTKAFLSVDKLKYSRIFLLTGTPLRKGPQDLWGMLHLVDGKRFRHYWSFVNRYCTVIHNGFGKEILPRPLDPISFKSMLDEYMIRRKKEEVLTELPDKIRQVYPLDMSPEQFRVHKELTEELLTEIGDDVLAVNGPMLLCLRLRQLLVCPRLLNIPEDGAALEALSTYLIPEEFAQGRSVVVGTPFRQAIPHIIEALKRSIKGIYIEVIHGEIKETAAQVAQRFQDHKGHQKVLIFTIKSGASWTAHAASTGFMLGYDWSAINNLQAEDRIHRLGQINKVMWKYLTYQDSIDKQVMDRLDDRAMAIGWTLTPKEFKEATIQIQNNYLNK